MPKDYNLEKAKMIRPIRKLYINRHNDSSLFTDLMKTELPAHLIRRKSAYDSLNAAYTDKNFARVGEATERIDEVETDFMKYVLGDRKILDIYERICHLASANSSLPVKASDEFFEGDLIDLKFDWFNLNLEEKAKQIREATKSRPVTRVIEEVQ